jgi:hypothetical protein
MTKILTEPVQKTCRAFSEKMQGFSRFSLHVFPKKYKAFETGRLSGGGFLLILFLLLGSFCGKIHAQAVTVEAALDSFQIYIGQQTKLRIQTSTARGEKILFPIFQDTLVGGVEIVGKPSFDTLYLNDGKVQQITGTYTITSFDSALYSLPPFPVKVNGTEYKTNHLVLKVYNVPVDVSKPDEFFPLRPQMNAPFVWSDWSYLVWLSFGMLLLLAVGFCILAFYKDNTPIIRKIKRKPAVPPHQKALQEIEQVKQDKLCETEGEKEYYTKLTGILRDYIRRRFGFNALEMTSGEIIARLQQENLEDNAVFSELKTLFQTADLVKFAKWLPEMNENDYNLICAVEFINETKQENPPAPEPEPIEERIERKRSLRMRILLLSMITVCFAGFICLFVYILLELQLLLI